MLRASNQYGREVITASVERLRARLDEVKVWLNTARFIAGDELQDSTKRAYAAGLFRYLLMLRISTKAALFEKLRSIRENETREKAFAVSIGLHSQPSERERERLRKESIRLFEFADRCGHKRWNDHLCFNRVTSWPFDFPYIATALRTIGMNPNDDLMPSESQSSNPSEIGKEPPARTRPDGVLASRPAQGTDLDDGLKLDVPFEARQHAKPVPMEPTRHSEPAGQPLVRTTSVVSTEGLGGRPRHAATDEYKKFKTRYDKLSLLAICQEFDEKKIPLPDNLSSLGLSNWIAAYKKNRAKTGAWLREKRREPRAPKARGKP